MGEHIAAYLLVAMMIYVTAEATSGQPKPGCPGTCGSLTIPYPFGTTPSCSFDESFMISCNNTKNGDGSGEKQKAFFPKSNIAILNISLADHEVRVESPVARDCYKGHGNLAIDDGTTSSMVTLSKFPISSRHNIFTAVGCDIVGLIQYDPNGNNGTSKTVRNVATGCFSFCNRFEDLQNGTCDGAGCCQISIPTDVIDFVTYTAQSLNNHSDATKFNNPCGYAFVVEKDEFNFSTLDLQNLRNRQTLPVVLDWAVGSQTCEQVKTNPKPPTYACQSNHSECHESNNGPGYICKCSQGFQGNPYLVDGCQDIDECETSSPCIDTAKCNNVPGGVNCICPNGNIGDGMRNGTGCTQKGDSKQSDLAIALGISICLLLLVIGCSWIYWAIKKRKFIRLKEKFFKKNGGILLQQQLSKNRRRSVELPKIFTADELKKATNNYDESRVLGQGGFGTVYKGILSDNKVVAIKKSKISDQNQIEQFINEVVVLSQVNHRNVVKLLGCCLETEVPLLVYEFITNGTLYSHIHDRTRYPSPLSWELRLKIAIETAGALSYLHSETSIPIIHRDVKTSNILLDENYIAKVSDFGASRLIPIDQSELTTLVRGTFGYLDPEYSQSSQLTEKSDVYSFGVVLVELLTGKKVLCFSRPENERNIAIYFVSSMKEDRLTQILDGKVAVNEEIMNQLKEVAILANKCLSLKGEERPTMKEVTTQLEAIIT